MEPKHDRGYTNFVSISAQEKNELLYKNHYLFSLIMIIALSSMVVSIFII
ncbi:hypothetical protein J2R98_002367 [Alkalibacillus filiformis]|uniref:Uncharacterized protein n=1 Tax=Alkalibacillus filiformis TaxID=200990 RepID=A0ABU0DVN5_9BACI|nr:hypothetical protein [Alkalibacillus filiformis]